MEENITSDSAYVVALGENPKQFGRMSDSTSCAVVKGPCGDEMQFYLVINNGIIEEARFHVQGCIFTIACGEIAAQFSIGKHINDALGISPKQVMEKLKGLPQGYSHCSILAVSTLHRAIANYLLKR